MSLITAYFVFLCLYLDNAYAGKKHYDRESRYMPPNTSNYCYYPERKIYDWELTPIEYCKRPCDGKPKLCHITLYIEQFTTYGVACLGCPEIMENCFKYGCISANGYPRAIISINRQMPGPQIEICQNDTLVVDVVNIMHESTTTIHWHGLRQMDGNQYYDGVPYITQCPIPPGNKFRYIFKVTECGTFWYHSHTGMQRLDGLLGALIVRCIFEPLKYLYDFDNISILIIDWTLHPARTLVSGFTIHKQNLSPETILINGRAPHYNESSQKYLPVTVFNVQHGKRYRIRIIGTCSYTCAYAIQIESHPVTIITLDGGHKIKPIGCDTVIVNAAERFDVILHANQSSDRVYLVLVEGVGNCKNVKSYAVLRYNNKTVNFKETELKYRTMFPLKYNRVRILHSFKLAMLLKQLVLRQDLKKKKQRIFVL
ncbi:unnamed protein product [Nezara viridula]|uniref:Uncharacterized protein n=1 Tax=Nezara viridula TaxID=85310 RepID=A0A9P0HDF5_NEZVI|nr:unnamed protein product [Nezara viridula]